MAAYYASVIYTCMQVREATVQYGSGDSIRVWDTASSAIVFAHSPEEAQSFGESTLRQQLEVPDRSEIKIRKMAVAPFVDKMLTEAGNVPLDWPKIMEQHEALLQSTSADDFEQGYWVDVNEVVRPDKLSFSAGTLESDVPEDIRSGLNWQADKKFFFLLLVLPPPKPSRDPITRLEEIVEGSKEMENENSTELSPAEIEELNAAFPATVALIQARNAVVAAWLWRRYAANTKWNANAIRIVPLCGVVNRPE